MFGGTSGATGRAQRARRHVLGGDGRCRGGPLATLGDGRRCNAARRGRTAAELDESSWLCVLCDKLVELHTVKITDRKAKRLSRRNGGGIDDRI